MPPHGDGEGTRFFGVPAWWICFALVVAGGVGLLAYTAAVR
ncbi:hypothetical protein [Streptomyces gossypii]|nr:hypothetical protein [Streptomyces gossypii]